MTRTIHLLFVATILLAGCGSGSGSFIDLSHVPDNTTIEDLNPDASVAPDPGLEGLVAEAVENPDSLVAQDVQDAGGHPSPTQSGMTAYPTRQIADGASGIVITVVVRNASGESLQGKIVTLEVTGTGNTISLPTTSSNITNASGIATFTLTSIMAEDKVVTATVDAGGADSVVITQTAAVTFTPGAPSELAAHSTVVATKTDDVKPNVPADNEATWTVTITLHDVNDTPVSGKLVSLATDPSTGVTITPAVSGSNQTDSSGIATFLIKSTKTGPKTVTATIAASVIPPAHDTIVLVETATVPFVAGPVSALLSTVTATADEVPADATTAKTITVTLFDANANPVPGAEIVLSAGDVRTSNCSGCTFVQPGTVTSEFGQASGAVKSSVAGTKTVKVTATVSEQDPVMLSSTTTVTFITIHLSVTGFPSPYISCSAPANVTITALKDDNSTFDKYGGTVTLTSLDNTFFVGNPASETEPGTYSYTFQAADNGTKQFPVRFRHPVSSTFILASAGNDQFIQSSIVVNDGFGFTSSSIASSTYWDGDGQIYNGVAIGDLNSDGRRDLAMAVTGSLRVFLATETPGTFNSPVSNTVASTPQDVAIGDVDGDGLADIVACNPDSNNVSLFLNNPDNPGTFLNHIEYSAGTGPVEVALADINGDGWLDIVTMNPGSTNVSVLINDPSHHGWFLAPTNLALSGGSSPVRLAIGDINRDGKPDIVVGNNVASGAVMVLLSDVTWGTFGSVASYLTGASGTSDVAIGDVNGDGYPDIVAANNTSSTISVLTGDGTGTNFTLYTKSSNNQPYNVDSSPKAVGLADFNGDGKLDLATTNGTSVSILLQTGVSGGQPSFDPMRTYAGSGYGADSKLNVGDLDNDGKPDLLTVSRAPCVYMGFTCTGLTSYFNNANDRCLPATDLFDAQSMVAISADQSHLSVAAGDLDRNGSPDLLVASAAGTNYLSKVLNTGTSDIFPGATTSIGNLSGLTSASLFDYNRDGKHDIIAVTSGTDSNVVVFPGNGNTTFGSAVTYSTGSGNGDPKMAALADMNRDGLPDLLTANSTGNNVSVFLGSSGTPPFGATPTSVAVGTAPNYLAVGDIDHDGKLDVVIANSGANTVSYLKGNGTGSFTAQTPLAVGTQPMSVALADLDNNGWLDIVTANHGSNNVSVLLNNANGIFVAASGQPFAVGVNPRHLVVVDVNGDGLSDIVTANAGGSVSILLGKSGFPMFQSDTPITISSGSVAPSWVEVADVNRDGRLDIIAASVGKGGGNGLVGVILGFFY